MYFLSFPFILITALFLWVSIGSTPPKDSELREMFFENRSGYEELKDKFEASRFFGIAEYGEFYALRRLGFTLPADVGVLDEEVEFYTGLLTSLDVQRIDRLDQGEIKISLAGWGFASDGWRIGLE